MVEDKASIDQPVELKILNGSCVSTPFIAYERFLLLSLVLSLHHLNKKSATSLILDLACLKTPIKG